MYPDPVRRTVVVELAIDISAFMEVSGKFCQARSTGNLSRFARVDVRGVIGRVYDGALNLQDFHDLPMAVFVFSGIISLEVVRGF